MVDFRRGIKAGLLAAAVFLAIAVVFELTGMSGRYPEVAWAAGLNLGREPWTPILATISLQTVLRVGGGILFGVVFAALYDHLPGTRGVVKGVMTAAFLWSVGVAVPAYVNLERLIRGVSVPYPEVVTLPPIDQVLVSSASTLVFGGLVGLMWCRLRAEQVAEVRRSTALLLVGWLPGVLVWAHAVVMFSTNVGVEGLFPADSGYGWFGLLVVLSASLGAAGWVFALLAWRKTSKGESGFAWGVAGGVLMAVTGLMLLPGVVSIIGAVLSRREPVLTPLSGSESPG